MADLVQFSSTLDKFSFPQGTLGIRLLLCSILSADKKIEKYLKDKKIIFDCQLFWA